MSAFVFVTGIEFLRYGPPCYQTHTGSGQYDWAYTDDAFAAQLADNGRVNPLGLYDLDRQQRPVGRAYQCLITQWKDVLVDKRRGVHLNY
jgi:hypothetical protein